jgi:hypothetical protein|tara:strand:+ start:132 stop:410 length:279 start_codon:yes stop_codon:yes gene_type:complete
MINSICIGVNRLQKVLIYKKLPHDNAGFQASSGYAVKLIGKGSNICERREKVTRMVRRADLIGSKYPRLRAAALDTSKQGARRRLVQYFKPI